MDEGVAERPSRVKVLDKSWERRPTLIDGTVSKTKLTDYSFNVKVGNTGLSMGFFDNRDGYRIVGDFRPGGYTAISEQEEPIPEKDAIRMFCYALYSFRNWATTTDEIDLSKVDYFTSVTNDAFRNFLKKFFAKNGHGDLIKVDSKIPNDPRQVGIELGKLLALPDDDPLVRKITQAGKRTEGMTVPALVRVA